MGRVGQLPVRPHRYAGREHTRATRRQRPRRHEGNGVNPADRLEAAAERFADTLNEAIVVRVQAALALERDRHDAELAELRGRVQYLEDYARGSALREAQLHSVRVEP